jgi:8-amino-7-oxononanoate synthase
VTALDEHERALRRRLDELAAAGLGRSLEPARGIDLVSNDTLGLCEHPLLRARMRAALEHEPAGAGAARMLRGERACFAALETRLARFCGSQAALLFPSGYAANVGLVQALAGREDLVVSDALNHASLIDGVRLSGACKAVVPHLDPGAVERALAEWRGAGRAFVLTESVFGMDGDLAPLRELADACERHDGLLIVDEAHATGVYGPTGAGRVEELGLRARVLATIHTGGKALGAAGAWIAGSALLREWLIGRARTFLFSTAPLPVLASALDAALDVLRDEPWRRAELHRKAARLRAALRERGVPCGGGGPIVPLIVGANDAAVALQRALQERGFDVRAVRPPTVPPGTARLRVSVRVPLADDDLLRLAQALGELWPAHALRDPVAP